MTRVPGTFKNRPGVLRELAVPPELAQLKARSVGLRRFSLDDCNILVSQEPIFGASKLLWHLSISHPDRYPTWDEIKVARYSLCPDDVTMAMILPPSEQYVNVPEQDNVFHLNEIEGE